jgi:hypothetical protein
MGGEFRPPCRSLFQGQLPPQHREPSSSYNFDGLEYAPLVLNGIDVGPRDK